MHDSHSLGFIKFEVVFTNMDQPITLKGKPFKSWLSDDIDFCKVETKTFYCKRLPSRRSKLWEFSIFESTLLRPR